ncbi:MAG: hypothetical protein R2856_07715 [Caldilineaceae bacterium]
MARWRASPRSRQPRHPHPAATTAPPAHHRRQYQTRRSAWELGLAETNQTLVLNDLRNAVRWRPTAS